MSSGTIYEIIGYIGSALIVISLAMSSIIRLRLINLGGSLVFTTYGVLIGSPPIVVTNVIIAGLDLWYLRRELTTREALDIVAVAPGDPFLAAFLDTYHHDIVTFVDPQPTPDDTDVRFVILRDANPAGVFLGVRGEPGTLRVLLDYVAPRYRDLESGSLLYRDDAGRFADLGYLELVVANVHSRQRTYFAKMGFVDGGDGTMVKRRTDARRDAA